MQRKAHNKGKRLVAGEYRHRSYNYIQAIILLATVSLCGILYITMGADNFAQAKELVSPEPTVTFIEVEQLPRENVDTMIGDAVDEFLPTHKSEARMIMHCLAHRENGHGGNPDAHGDNGLAGGPFQFHQATWDRMRKQMIAKGVAGEIGSRYDFKESARTTAWAIANGRALEWGPILRESLKDINPEKDFATCQVPHWYQK